jgi:hypothetical protein
MLANLEQFSLPQYTDKKENQIFLIHREIQNGADAKLYMRKGFLICILFLICMLYEERLPNLYEEMRK